MIPKRLSLPTSSKRSSVVRADANVFETAADVYRTFLASPPIEISYNSPTYLVPGPSEPVKRIVGVELTPSGWFGLSVVLLFQLISRIGLRRVLQEGFPSKAMAPQQADEEQPEVFKKGQMHGSDQSKAQEE